MTADPGAQMAAAIAPSGTPGPAASPARPASCSRHIGHRREGQPAGSRSPRPETPQPAVPPSPALPPRRRPRAHHPRAARFLGPPPRQQHDPEPAPAVPGHHSRATAASATPSPRRWASLGRLKRADHPVRAQRSGQRRNPSCRAERRDCARLLERWTTTRQSWFDLIESRPGRVFMHHQTWGGCLLLPHIGRHLGGGSDRGSR